MIQSPPLPTRARIRTTRRSRSARRVTKPQDHIALASGSLRNPDSTRKPAEHPEKPAGCADEGQRRVGLDAELHRQCHAGVRRHTRAGHGRLGRSVRDRRADHAPGILPTPVTRVRKQGPDGCDLLGIPSQKDEGQQSRALSLPDGKGGVAPHRGNAREIDHHGVGALGGEILEEVRLHGIGSHAEARAAKRLGSMHRLGRLGVKQPQPLATQRGPHDGRRYTRPSAEPTEQASESRPAPRHSPTYATSAARPSVSWT